MRSLPKTPLSQALWIVCILACVLMITVSTVLGLAVMSVALGLTAVAWLAGVR